MKAYQFNGWEAAHIRDSLGLTPCDYYDLLSEIWCEETCAPRMRKDWTPENRTLGQCSITAFLIQDIYGGKVYGVPLGDGNFHCFNDVNGCVFDLTSEQFGDTRLDYTNCPEQDRAVHFAKAEKRERYELLKERLFARRPALTPITMEHAEGSMGGSRRGEGHANDQEQIVIRKAMEADVGQIAEIMVEDWKRAYNGIIDSAFLDAMNVEQRYAIEIQRYQKYMVATDGKEILGYAWNEMIEEETADCEIFALYVRYDRRKSGIGKALFQNAINSFRGAGKKRMIIWCLKENREARQFYERMGGKTYQTGTHTWGNRAYELISYLYRLDE